MDDSSEGTASVENEKSFAIGGGFHGPVAAVCVAPGLGPVY